MKQIIINENKDYTVINLVVTDNGNTIDSIDNLDYNNAENYIHRYLHEYDFSDSDTLVNNVLDGEQLIQQYTINVSEYV